MRLLRVKIVFLFMMVVFSYPPSYGGVSYAAMVPLRTRVAFYLVGHLGSTRVVTNGSGAEQARYSYYPYGEILAPHPNPLPLGERAKGEGDLSYLFTGQKFDTEINLYYYGARYYDPKVGKFTSADPIVQHFLPCDLNSYAYVWNNPLTVIDPSGAKEYRKMIQVGGNRFQATITESTGWNPSFNATIEYLDVQGNIAEAYFNAGYDAATKTFTVHNMGTSEIKNAFAREGKELKGLGTKLMKEGLAFAERQGGVEVIELLDVVELNTVMALKKNRDISGTPLFKMTNRASQGLDYSVDKMTIRSGMVGKDLVFNLSKKGLFGLTFLGLYWNTSKAIAQGKDPLDTSLIALDEHLGTIYGGEGESEFFFSRLWEIIDEGLVKPSQSSSSEQVQGDEPYNEAGAWEEFWTNVD
ncbi:MAG: RHS repeat-associated core domain-containing protein [Deltaproteobacteria bacterium]|nr:RHS repeat-associated core domain-containing protein [Deltaproteobacteria bacterium]